MERGADTMFKDCPSERMGLSVFAGRGRNVEGW